MAKKKGREKKKEWRSYPVVVSDLSPFECYPYETFEEKRLVDQI